jgi:hypothetical protein
MGKNASLLFLGLGILVTFVAGQAAWHLGSALNGLGPAPRSAHVAGAPATEWLRLDDARVSCQSRLVGANATYFHASAADGSEPFLVQALGETSCESLVLEGGFMPETYTPESTRERLRTEPPPGVVSFRVFSQMISPGFLRSGLYRALPMLGMGLLMTGLALRGYRRVAAAGAARR